MNENAKKWVKALRSGEYKQGEGRLAYSKNNHEALYCCLGVACDLYKKENPDDFSVDFEEIDDDHGLVEICFDHNNMFLPEIVQKWLNLASIDGVIQSQSTSLSELNDSGESFEYIASIIEEEEKELFEY